VQASSAWTPPTGTLGAIVAEAFDRAALLRAHEAELAESASSGPPSPSLKAALKREAVAIIAEVKRRSPSKGWINPDISAVDQALSYERGGAAAVSILTEPAHFGGSVSDLVSVRDSIAIPVLKKDFHVDPIQLIEAKALGASAALLIARALSPDALPQMVETARQLGLEVIVEIRDDEELTRALDAGAGIIGINNRNLETLAIDPATSERLLSRIPPGVVAIAESGVESRTDVERFARCGADAVLVGSILSASEDPIAAVKQLTGVPRVSRGG
jgi:indole-3-glycerol phosphate synthase